MKVRWGNPNGTSLRDRKAWAEEQKRQDAEEEQQQQQEAQRQQAEAQREREKAQRQQAEEQALRLQKASEQQQREIEAEKGRRAEERARLVKSISDALESRNGREDRLKDLFQEEPSFRELLQQIRQLQDAQFDAPRKEKEEGSAVLERARKACRHWQELPARKAKVRDLFRTWGRPAGACWPYFEHLAGVGLLGPDETELEAVRALDSVPGLGRAAFGRLQELARAPDLRTKLAPTLPAEWVKRVSTVLWDPVKNGADLRRTRNRPPLPAAPPAACRQPSGSLPEVWAGLGEGFGRLPAGLPSNGQA